MVKTLYARFKEAELIEKEVYTESPFRVQQKTMGYMWSGKKTLFLKDGREFRFSIWHHFMDDVGTILWKPSEKKMEKAFKPILITIDGCLYDVNWHTEYMDKHIYGTKKGKFMNHKYSQIIKKKIKDGSWKEDSDIHIII